MALPPENFLITLDRLFNAESYAVFKRFITELVNHQGLSDTTTCVARSFVSGKLFAPLSDALKNQKRTSVTTENASSPALLARGSPLWVGFSGCDGLNLQSAASSGVCEPD